MYYESELQFLQATFEKCHVQTLIVDPAQPLDPHLSIGLQMYFSADAAQLTLEQLFPHIQNGIIYKLTDHLFCRHMFFRLPETSQKAVLVIGPFLTTPPSSQEIMEWAEELGISPGKQQQVVDFYNTIPLLSESSHLFAMVESFGDRIWGKDSFTVEEINDEAMGIPALLAQKLSFSEGESPIYKMESMERRYAFENELMEAVSRGQTHKAQMLVANLSAGAFEQRLADPIRNLKNYCIITNTLLRKAAEKGGVHPLYLDSLSSSFALQIEQSNTTQAIYELIAQMFRSYCHLVRKHSMKNYSPPVQKAITCIDADLTGNLNLRTLAGNLNVSSSYLSALFKKETGQTLTEYINNRRVKHAIHLLETTKLQIQTIAQHCGIMDVHYFSKVFKRITGTTPKAYRASLRD